MTARDTALALSILLMLGVAASAPEAPAAPPAVMPEDLSTGIKVNGVALQITRLRGDGVGAYVRKLRETWGREEGGGATPATTWVDLGDWRMASRRIGHWSEVLQVRKDPANAEAILSRVDVSRAPTPLPVMALGIPSPCRAASTVEFGDAGVRTLQVSARCRAGVAQVAAEFRRRALSSGWQEQGRQRGSTLQLTHGALHATIVVGPDDAGSAGNGTWVVAVEQRQSGGTR